MNIQKEIEEKANKLLNKLERFFIMEKKTKKLQRFLSGIILFPIIALVLIFSNDVALDIFLAVVSIFCVFEYSNCFKTGDRAHPSKWYLYIVSLLLSFTSSLSNEAVREIIITILPISILILTIEMIFSKGKKNINDIVVTIFGIVYIPLMLIFLSFIRSRFELGKIIIWYIFISAWGSDIFAYLVGSRIGKHKFTKISPNKSIEGCVAGVLGALIISIVFTIIINNVMNLTISVLMSSIIVIILSVIGQIGDLVASSIKRYCGIKDFSELIPGHGGLLDRIDSVILILPFAYILLGLLV